MFHVEPQLLVTNIVSIPYGTIKRGGLRYVYPLIAAVSIPYGTIKSSLQMFSKSLIRMFQFLMVQLKVYIPEF